MSKKSVNDCSIKNHPMEKLGDGGGGSNYDDDDMMMLMTMINCP